MKKKRKSKSSAGIHDQTATLSPDALEKVAGGWWFVDYGGGMYGIPNGWGDCANPIVSGGGGGYYY